MRTALTVLLIGLVGVSFATIDYSTGALGSTCTKASGAYSSPVNFANTGCAPYGVFELTLPDVTAATPDKTANFLNNMFVGYSNGKLNFNGTEYTTDSIAFHYGGEHGIYGEKGDLEMNIYLSNADGYLAGALSFSFWGFVNIGGESAQNEGRRVAYNSNSNNQIITSLSDTDWTLELSKLANIINSKDENDLFLNVHYYLGTPNYGGTTGDCVGFHWFVYGGQLLIEQTVLDAFKAAIAAEASNVGATLDGDNNALKFTDFGGSNLDVTKLCYTGYFQVTMYANYGLWFCLGLCLLFFMFTLSMDPKPLHNTHYTENVWTNHPIYSIWFQGNEIHSRKSRSALVYIQIINFFVWNAVFFKGAYDEGTGTNGENVITFALQTLPISWGIGYIAGYPLRKYYIAKHKYEQSNNGDDDDRAQFWIYIFYTLIFILMWVGFAWTTALMDMVNSHVDSKISDLWVAAVFIDIALEWLFFDLIAVWVCKKWDAYKRWSRWRGYLYDDVCHQTYLAAFKKE